MAFEIGYWKGNEVDWLLQMKSFNYWGGFETWEGFLGTRVFKLRGPEDDYTG